MDFSEKDISEFVSILSRNKIKIEFEDKEDFLKGMEQIARKASKKVSLENFHKTALLKLKEYDVSNLTLISTGVGYPYRFFDYCPIPNIKDCIDIILKIFNEVCEGIALNFMGNYGIMYSGDDKNQKYEGAYFWINKEIFNRATLDEKRYFFECFYVPKKHIDFIFESDQVSVFDYIGFNKKNLITKYAIAMPYQSFVSKNPEIHYGDYCNFDKVFSMLKVKKPDDWMSLQISASEPSYLAFETFMEKHEFNDYVDKMLELGLITEDTRKNLFEFDFGNLHQFVVKFRWDNKDKFSIKVYTEEFLK